MASIDFSKMDTGDNLGKTVIYKGRVVQCDADFYCYFAANLDYPLHNNMKHLLNILETNRKLCGAEHMNAHITMGSKGGRHEMATVKPYQADRNKADPEVKERVRELRSELANWWGTDEITVIANVVTEADDSIVSYHTAYNASGLGLSIIDSGDKDLNMAQGTHRDSNSKRLVNVTGYGKTGYKEVGNKEPKLKGYGDSWFWHQMLMGDGTDDIPGLEKVGVDTLNEYKPTKKFNPKRKPGLCGEKTAVRILSQVTDSKTAGNLVLSCYRETYGSKAVERFVEQGFLLWMRRNKNPWDSIDFYKECGLVGVEPTKGQLNKVGNWKQLMIGLHGKGVFDEAA